MRRIVRQEDGEDVATTAGALATRVFRSAPARRRCESFLCKPILLQKRRAGSSYVGDVGVVRAQESHGIPTRNHKESRRGIQHDEPRNARNRRISRENPTSKCLRRSLGARGAASGCCGITGAPNATCENWPSFVRHQSGVTNLEVLHLQIISPSGMSHLPLCSARPHGNR